MALDREKTLQSAQKYIDRRKYDKAVEEYQKIVREDPKDARTLLKIGDLQARMQAYADAIATYDRVGQQYAAQGFALKAIAVYKQVRELIRKHAPELADEYAHIVPKLAEIYTELGLPNDALAAYDEVATHFQRTGREREATDVFRKMVELDPTNPLPHLRLAEACCRVNELDRAIDSFWKAAELLLGLSRRDDALKVIERILHFRQDPQYARAAAELYLQKGTREDGLQALAKLQICFQANPKDLDTLGFLAQAFMAINAEAKAIEVYKEMARVAREIGKTDLFDQLLAHLMARAPNDDQVRALRSLPPATTSAPAPAPVSRGSAAIEEADLEVLEELSGAAGRPRTQPPVPARGSTRPRMASVPDVVVAVDEAPSSEQTAMDLREHARKATVDAESFRKLRLYTKSIEALRLALELDPGSVEIRDKLRFVLEESGDLDGAAAEAVALAEIYLAHQDQDTAHALCDEALQLSPDNMAARQLLTQLGIMPSEYAAWQATYGAAPGEPAPRRSFPSEPLPSYELDPSDAVTGRPPLGFDGVDDPFGELDHAPLPSFPLAPDEETTKGRHFGTTGKLPSFGDADDSLGLGDYAPASEFADTGSLGDVAPREASAVGAEIPAADVAAPSNGSPARIASLRSRDLHVEAVEEALEEAEFFASRGLYEEARGALNDQLVRTPNHPLLLERLRELGQVPAESGTIDRSQIGESLRSPPPRDGDYDVAASLDALDAVPGSPPSGGSRSKFRSVRDDVDVDEVFAKFKEGIRQQVPENDAATHYDLGVAYKEMGLLNDAMQAFEMAARDPERECNCFAMIGFIGLEQGKLEVAERAYLRGLEAEKKTVEQEMALYYDLGNVKEMRDQRDEALYYFKKIARRDPGFRDVKDRIAALEPPPLESTPRSAADDDEFDAVFDKLFESS